MVLMKTPKKDNSFLISNGLEPKKKILRVLDQTGASIDKLDSKRKALLPGKRISKSGKVYWETRKNRSDQANKQI